jgi:hypothetical protein
MARKKKKNLAPDDADFAIGTSPVSGSEGNSRSEDKRRQEAVRKQIEQIDVLNVKNTENGEVYFSRASIVDISPTGLLLRVSRADILALPLRSTLTFSQLHSVSVGFTIEIMDTYIEGYVARTKLEDRSHFLVAVDIREDAPEYWRQCLVELLPDPADAD